MTTIAASAWTESLFASQDVDPEDAGEQTVGAIGKKSDEKTK